MKQPSQIVHEGWPNTIVFADDPLAPTGFGAVNRGISMGFREKMNLLYYCINGDGMPVPNDWPWPRIPAMCWGNTGPKMDHLGRERFLHVLDKYGHDGLDHVFLMHDHFELTKLCDPPHHSKIFIDHVADWCEHHEVKMHVYFPVDGTPKEEWLRPLMRADTLRTYTHYGWRECIKVVPDMRKKLGVLYHGTSPDNYYPIPEDDREEIRKNLGINDSFTLLFVGQNHLRKRLDWLMIYFKDLLNSNVGDFKLLLHTNPERTSERQWCVPTLMKSLRIPKESVVFTKKGYGVTTECMNDLYNAADLYVHHCPEGWGLPITEAMCAGTPVLGADHTSISEIIGDDRGVLFKINEGGDGKINWPGEWFVRPNPSISDAVSKTIEIRDDPDMVNPLKSKAMEWTKTIQWQDVARMLTRDIIEGDGSPVFITEGVEPGQDELLDALEVACVGEST